MQLQTQVKDSHLNQLGEVEKRFRTISRQSAVVRQVHEKLEQNGRPDARQQQCITHKQPEPHTKPFAILLMLDSSF